MRTKLCFFILALSVSIEASSQFSEQIRTGRPGQAIGTFVVGNKVFQLQSGFTRSTLNKSYQDEGEFTFSNVVRYGIGDRFELSGVVGYKSFNSSSDEGINSTQLGGRYHLTQLNGIIPNSCIQGRFSLKAEDNDFKRSGFVSSWIYSFSYKILQEYSLTTNIVFQTERKTKDWSYVLNISRGLNERFSAFIEAYGDLNLNQNYLDTGVGFLLNDDIQLDISAGIDIISGRNEWFIDAGISMRLYRKG